MCKKREPEGGSQSDLRGCMALCQWQLSRHPLQGTPPFPWSLHLSARLPQASRQAPLHQPKLPPHHAGVQITVSTHGAGAQQLIALFKDAVWVIDCWCRIYLV